MLLSVVLGVFTHQNLQKPTIRSGLRLALGLDPRRASAPPVGHFAKQTDTSLSGLLSGAG